MIDLDNDCWSLWVCEVCHRDRMCQFVLMDSGFGYWACRECIIGHCKQPEAINWIEEGF